MPVADEHTGQTVYRTALIDVTEVKELQRQVLEISEREQARIGQDLHDGPCQTLTGIAILAEVASRELDGANLEIAAQIREIARSVRESADEVRRLAAGMFPVKIERYGLAWALRELAADTSRLSAAQCSFRMAVPIVITDQGAAIHLYRIAQEAISNAVRHGRASEIALELAASAGAVSLTIRDDGDGIPSEPPGGGLGLHTMRYRARMLGGSLEVAEAAPRGTAVVCTFPGKEVAHVETRSRKKEEDIPR